MSRLQLRSAGSGLVSAASDCISSCSDFQASMPSEHVRVSVVVKHGLVRVNDHRGDEAADRLAHRRPSRRQSRKRVAAYSWSIRSVGKNVACARSRRTPCRCRSLRAPASTSIRTRSQDAISDPRRASTRSHGRDPASRRNSTQAGVPIRITAIDRHVTHRGYPPSPTREEGELHWFRGVPPSNLGAKLTAPCLVEKR